ncbi:MAG TPA: fatty acid desaturase, partial [Phenylobacterium sp.]|jgi:omega-6 fatty acid desaturase (delta-12 desaturase)
MTVIAASIGVWLFYIQHQFEGAYWARTGTWRVDEAAFYGSSQLVMPPVLGWLTANIGVHHVHHAAARIPFYRVPQVLRDHPELKAINRVGLREAFRAVRLSLWDESKGRLVSFREASRG